MRRRTIPRTIFVLAALALGGAATAFAFNLGGHYFSVLAVFSSGKAPIDDGRATEAFCSELPDMSKELDAITLRSDVFWSVQDRGWGSGGHCDSPVSRHMVQVQFYLHALTGRGASVPREAAKQMLRTLGERIAASSENPQELANLHCERGFAAHLLGDTFAHVQLKSDPKTAKKYADPIGVLYDTGLGHFRDGVNPDYMLWRSSPSFAESVQWTGWIKAVADYVDGRTSIRDAEELLKETATARASTGSADDIEKKFIDELQHNTGALWLVELPEAKHDWTWSQTQACDDQVKRYFDKRQPKPSDRPNCAIVWHDYLALAQQAFAAAHYTPDDSCAAPATALSDADHH